MVDKNENTKEFLDSLKNLYANIPKDELDEEADVYRSCFEEHIKNLSLNARGIWDYVFGEMVNNVIEHSEASELDLIIKQDYLCTEVRIIDDGIGFDLNDPSFKSR